MKDRNLLTTGKSCPLCYFQVTRRILISCIQFILWICDTLNYNFILLNCCIDEMFRHWHQTPLAKVCIQFLKYFMDNFKPEFINQNMTTITRGEKQVHTRLSFPFCIIEDTMHWNNFGLDCKLKSGLHIVIMAGVLSKYKFEK